MPRNFLPLVSLNENFATRESVLNTAFMYAEITDGVAGASVMRARIKSVPLTDAVLGYSVDAIGSYSLGSPRNYIHNKNGLNYPTFDIEVEENSAADVLAYFANKVYGLNVSGQARFIGEGDELAKTHMVPSIKVHFMSGRGGKLYRHRTVEFSDCLVLGVGMPTLSTNATGSIKYSVSINPLDVKIDNFRDGVEFEENLFKEFMDGYEQPLAEWMWVAHIPNVPSVSVREISLKMNPDIEIAYLGNPKYGKPFRTTLMTSSQIGSVNFTIVDDREGSILRSLLGGIKNSDGTPLHQMFGARNNNVYSLGMGKVGGFPIVVQQYACPKAKVNEAQVGYLPILQFKYFNCAITAISQTDYSSDSNEHCLLSVTAEIGSVVVQREEWYGIVNGQYTLDDIELNKGYNEMYDPEAAKAEEVTKLPAPEPTIEEKVVKKVKKDSVVKAKKKPKTKIEAKPTEAPPKPKNPTTQKPNEPTRQVQDGLRWGDSPLIEKKEGRWGRWENKSGGHYWGEYDPKK